MLLEMVGLPVDFYKTKREQYIYGESVQGVEIKFDGNFARTGNLYIEIAEKTAPSDTPYIGSGIFRKDNTWLYAIGNYEIIFLFLKKDLIKLFKNKKFLREVKTDTSKGFLLDNKAHKYAIKVIHV